LCGNPAKKNGRRLGKQRYYCPSCRSSFLRKKQLPVTFFDFLQFHKLITGKTNRANILSVQQVSRKTLSVRFARFFKRPLSAEVVWDILPLQLSTKAPWVYGVDGKWLRRAGVLIIHRNVTSGANLYWSYHPSESYMAYEIDLKRFTQLIHSTFPSGVVSDWKGSIVSAMTIYLRSIPHQRCLTHVVREAKRYLPKHSPFEATRELRHIARSLIHIKTKQEKWRWMGQLIRWEHIFGHMLKERTKGGDTKKKWWYTHGNIRAGWRLLTQTYDPFFEYLNHPCIPHSNNSLEGVNSQIKTKLANHRGMKTKQQVSFLFWYLTFTRATSKQDLKKLWDRWKLMKKSDSATIYVT